LGQAVFAPTRHSSAGGRFGGRRVHGPPNTVSVFQSFVVPETQHAIPLGSQPRCSLSVVFALFGRSMLCAVDLHDEARWLRNEIQDEIADHGLSPPVQSDEFAFVKQPPHRLLVRRHLSTHLLGARLQPVADAPLLLNGGAVSAKR
jgi:hypothetical protein